MIRNNFISKKFLVGLICLLFVFLLGFLIIDGYLNLNRDLKIHSADMMYMIDQRTTSLLFEMNIFPQHTGNDLLFLSKLSSLQEIISNEGESKNQIVKDLEEDFLKFIKKSNAYYQLRYIDEKGDEVVRVEFDGYNYEIIPENELQNKKHRYYFIETMKLDKGEVYISPLDLNIENRVIENSGTEENPVYVPVMRSATPVFDNGALKGIVIFNIYANYFLEDIRRFQREGETVFLINKQGYYLAHPNRTKEFAFMLDRDDNFYSDYPEISKEILLDFSKRRFESDGLIFSFRHIYPTANDPAIHKGAERIFGENPEERYFWILVSVSEKTEINKTLYKLKSDYMYFLLFSGFIILIIIFLVIIVIFKTPEKINKGGGK